MTTMSDGEQVRDEEMPAEPSNEDRQAIMSAQFIAAHVDQGFTRDEAFELLKLATSSRLDAYWDHHFLEHGCGAPLAEFPGRHCGEVRE